MQLDFEKYRPYVDSFDMSEARKIELFEIVSNMMRGFVDLAFEDTPEQILLGTTHDCSPDDDWLAIESEHELTSIFNKTAEKRGEDEAHE